MTTPVKIYTSAEMRRHEQMAVDAGTSFLQLMENAGQAAAHDILKRHPRPGRALIACGKGNNGGDGLVIARVLSAADWQVDTVLVLGDKLSELAAINYRRLQSPVIPFTALPAALRQNGYDIYIDALFGTGFRGTLPAEAAQCCRLLNQVQGRKIALDLPSGLDSDSGTADADSFHADLTYAFAAFKPAHFSTMGKRLCGEVLCLDIGID